MNTQEIKAVLVLILLFILGIALVAFAVYEIAQSWSYYVLGGGLFLMAVSGLFIYREIKD